MVPELTAFADEQLDIRSETFVAWHISEIANRMLALLYPAFFDWHDRTDVADECNDHLRSRYPTGLATLLQKIHFATSYRGHRA